MGLFFFLVFENILGKGVKLTDVRLSKLIQSPKSYDADL